MEKSRIRKPIMNKLISFTLALGMLLSTTVMSAYAVEYDPNTGHENLRLKF